jgi:hypothetical protein
MSKYRNTNYCHHGGVLSPTSQSWREHIVGLHEIFDGTRDSLCRLGSRSMTPTVATDDQEEAEDPRATLKRVADKASFVRGKRHPRSLFRATVASYSTIHTPVSDPGCAMACNRRRGARRECDAVTLTGISNPRLIPPCRRKVTSPRVRKTRHEHTSPFSGLPLTSKEASAGATLRGMNPP